MVIFYGGSAFSSSSTGANANTLQNAGTNVISAVSLARANGTAVTDLASLTTNNYLQDAPSLPSGVGAATLVGGIYQVAGVPADVCAKVNSNLGVTQAADVASSTSKMGCAADGTFFARG